MSIATGQALVTPEELLAMPNSVDFELVDGELKGRSMSSLSSWVGGRTFQRLGTHVEIHRLGWVFPADSGYQCFPASPRSVRKPDVSFVRLDRLSADEIRDGWLRVVPDLVVEVVSPHDLFSDVEEKISAYLDAGVPLIWIINPPTRSVRVIRGDGTTTDLRKAGELSGEQVVPGFLCPVGDLFPPRPSPDPA